MSIEIGIYEKAIRRRETWSEFFAAAAAAGFAFVDLSVDESDERIERLTWPDTRRCELRAAANREGIALGGICRSIIHWKRTDFAWSVTGKTRSLHGRICTG